MVIGARLKYNILSLRDYYCGSVESDEFRRKNKRHNTLKCLLSSHQEERKSKRPFQQFIIKRVTKEGCFVCIVDKHFEKAWIKQPVPIREFSFFYNSLKLISFIWLYLNTSYMHITNASMYTLKCPFS